MCAWGRNCGQVSEGKRPRWKVMYVPGTLVNQGLGCVPDDYLV